MSNYIVSDTSLGSVAEAIRTKGGTSAPLTYPQGFIDAIDDIQTGGSAVIQALSVTENGTYTAPSGVDGYSPVTVNVSGGDEPIPDDGKTRIWIHIAEGTPDNRLTFYLRFTASEANNTTVDWGDGTVKTLGTTTAVNYTHKYPSSGDYIIVMTVNSGTIAFDGSGVSPYYAIYGLRVNNSGNEYNRFRITRVIIGNNVSRIGEYCFYFCTALSNISFTAGITSIENNAFNLCYTLNTVIIPEGVTSIGSNAFDGAQGLKVLTLPSTLTSIGTRAFGSCYGMSEYHFKPTTPPTLTHDSVFANIPSDCIIYVPQGSLSAYQQATNWSVWASYIREEPT